MSAGQQLKQYRSPATMNLFALQTGNTRYIIDFILATSLFISLRLLKSRLTCAFALTLSTAHSLTIWVVFELLAFFGRIKRSDELPWGRKLFYSIEVAFCEIATYLTLVRIPIPLAELWQLLTIFDPAKLSARQLLPFLLSVSGILLLLLDESAFSIMGIVPGLVSSLLTVHLRKSTNDLRIDPFEFQLSILPEVFSVSLILSTVFENLRGNTFVSTEFSIIDVFIIFVSTLLAVGSSIYRLTQPAEHSEIIGIAKSGGGVLFGSIFVLSVPELLSPRLTSIVGLSLGFAGAFMYLNSIGFGGRTTLPDSAIV
jgi:hypothetical protein